MKLEPQHPDKVRGRRSYAMRRVLLSGGFAFLTTLTTVAQPGEPIPLLEARRALAEKIPEAAIVKLRSALASTSLSAADRKTGLRLLAEAQVDAARPADAIETLAPLTDPDDTAAVLLRAMALIGEQRWKEALAAFESLGTRGDSPPAAAIGKAEVLQALGRTPEAISTLEGLMASGKAPLSAAMRLATLLIDHGKEREARKILGATPKGAPAEEHWRRYLEARIHLLEKKPDSALADLAPLLGGQESPRPPGLTPNLFAAAKLAETEAHLLKSGAEAARKVLESFVRQNPGNSHLEIAFRRLDQLYAADTNPDDGALTALARDPRPTVAALAQFYLARIYVRAKNYDRATATLRTFLESHPDHGLTPYAHFMLADVAFAQNDLAGTESALDAASRTAKTDEFRSDIALRTALLNLRQGEFVRASTGFRNASLRSPRLRQYASYNLALTWLLQKNYALFEEELKSYIADFPDPLLAGNLRLEEGLSRARSGDPDAPVVLRAFLAAHPGHPRRAEARFAFAELAFNDGNVGQAETLLRQVATDAPSPEMSEQGEYLAIFLEDAKKPRDENKVIAQAREFIRRHPASPLITEVRMKLGQVLFRREDFLSAQEQFETLAREQPDGAYSTPALFLAGQCAVKLQNAEALNHALELFGSVAVRHGPLEANARIQQAIIKIKLGAPDDAVKIYDSILSSPTPPETQVRLAALVGKGDSHAILGKSDPKQLDVAIVTYDRVIAAADDSPTWRNQAAYKKAKALQQLNRHDEALTVLYDILDKAVPGTRETFWLGRAGFDAAGIVEGRQQWKSAVGVYEKMAAIPGPHAEQARQRAKTLRLEHFLWD